MLKRILVAVLAIAFAAAGVVQAQSVPSCTLTGTVQDASGAPLKNGVINFDSIKTQVIAGQAVARLIKSINTDPNGVIGPNTFAQLLAVSITICDQFGNCGAPFSAIIPNSSSSAFGNMIMGSYLTQPLPNPAASGQIFGVNSNNTAEWQTVSGGRGNCSFVWNSTASYTLNCPGFATLASPTFTGTVGFPDGATWTTAGVNNATHIGIGQAAGVHAIDITGNQNANTTGLAVSNNSTGTSAASVVVLSNGTTTGSLGYSGTAYTASGAQLPPNSEYLYTGGSGGIVLDSTTTAPINFWVNNIQIGSFSSTALSAILLHLTAPLEIVSGGVGTATPPSAAQILIAQSATAYAPMTMNGDATISSTGAVTVTKTNGVALGAAPTVGQMLIAQSTTAYAPETISGDATITASGVVTVGAVHFGVTNPVTLTGGVPPNSGGIPYFASATTLTSSAVMTAGLPIIGGGAGFPPMSASRSGNTTTFATTAGTPIANHCVQFDASFNLVDAGGACGISGGPNFPPGSPPQIAGYSATNVSEAETVSGDFTFARAGLNSYVATVTRSNGTLLTALFAPIASPTFTGTVTLPTTNLPDGSTWNSSGVTFAPSHTMTFPDLSTYTSAGHNNMKALGIGQAAAGGTIPLGITENQNSITAIQVLNNNSGTSAQAGAQFSNGTYLLNAGISGSGYTGSGATTFQPANGAYLNTAATGGLNLSVNAPATAPITHWVNNNFIAQFRPGGMDIGSSTVGPDSLDITNNVNGIAQASILNNSSGAAAVAQLQAGNGTSFADVTMLGTGYTGNPNIAPNTGVFSASATNGMDIVSYINNPAAPIRFWTNGGFMAQIRSGGMDIYSGVGLAQAVAGPDPLDITKNQNAPSSITLTNTNAGSAAQSSLVLSNGTTEGNIGFTSTGFAGPPGGIGANTEYLYTTGPGGIALASTAGGAINNLINNTSVGGFINNGTNFQGLSLPGYASVGATQNSLTGFNVGQGYITSNGFATMYMHTASRLNLNGQWYADGGAGAGAAMIGLIFNHIYFYEAGATAPGAAMAWVNIASWSKGLNVAHINSLKASKKPTVSSGQLTERARDMTGTIMNVTGSKTTLTFGEPYDGDPECALTDLGKAYSWYELERSSKSATFVCWDHDNKAPCPDGQHVTYICMGSGGDEEAPDPNKVAGAKTPTPVASPAQSSMAVPNLQQTGGKK